MSEADMSEDVMSDEAPADSNRPSHIAYWIRERENKKGDWNAIGAAWAHADGKGFNLVLDLQPRDGRVTLRQVASKPA